MIQLFARMIAAVYAAAIIFMTLGPVAYRLQTGHPQLERFGAYFVMAVAFTVGFPRHRKWVALGVVSGAFILELGQLMAPGRDAGVPDAIAKAAGAMAGVLVASAFNRVLHRPRV